MMNTTQLRLIMTRMPENESVGEWTAYVGGGHDVQERRARLKQVPAAILEKVKTQVATAVHATNNKRRYKR